MSGEYSNENIAKRMIEVSKEMAERQPENAKRLYFYGVLMVNALAGHPVKLNTLVIPNDFAEDIRSDLVTVCYDVAREFDLV